MLQSTKRHSHVNPFPTPKMSFPSLAPTVLYSYRDRAAKCCGEDVQPLNDTSMLTEVSN